MRIGVPAAEGSLNLELFRGYELEPGSYEFRARAVDLNGFAQPAPRPYQKSGMNLVPCQILTWAIRRRSGVRGSWTGCR